MVVDQMRKAPGITCRGPSSRSLSHPWRTVRDMINNTEMTPTQFIQRALGVPAAVTDTNARFEARQRLYRLAGEKHLIDGFAISNPRADGSLPAQLLDKMAQLLESGALDDVLCGDTSQQRVSHVLIQIYGAGYNEQENHEAGTARGLVTALVGQLQAYTTANPDQAITRPN